MPFVGYLLQCCVIYTLMLLVWHAHTSEKEFCLVGMLASCSPNHFWALEICFITQSHDRGVFFFFLGGLCSLALVLGMFLIVCSAVQCQENMNKWLWNAVTIYHECSMVYPNWYCWDQRNIKKTGWKQKLRFVAIMQFLEVPWNSPWALWEGYCGSAMQDTTLNSTKLPGSTTDLWELQTAFTASLSTQISLFCDYITQGSKV